MVFLKQSTAVTVKIGPFVDSGDGNTDETGLTISQADVRLSKAGGDLAQKNNSSSCTHDEIGIYDCPLSTTDTNTVGPLELFVHESGALPVWHKFMVLPASSYDAIVAGTGNGIRADVQAIADGLLTAGKFAADCFTAAKFAADVGQEFADALLGRNIAGGSSAGRLVKDALRFLRNKVTYISTTMTVYEEDDTATAWTATIATSPGDPISSVDPA